MQARIGSVVVLVVLIVLASYFPLSYAQQSSLAQTTASKQASDTGQGRGAFSSCPQRLRVLDRRGELADAALFIGLPEKKDELKRPAKQQQWALAKLHKRAAAKKEGLFLQCRYKDSKEVGLMKASITLPVPPFASACVISKENKGETRIRCE